MRVDEINTLLIDSKTALEEALKDVKYMIENWETLNVKSKQHVIVTTERESLSNIRLAYDSMRKSFREMSRSYFYEVRRRK